MINKKNLERHLWVSTVVFVTYLLLSSFIVSRNYLEIFYLIVFYLCVIIAKIVDKK